jgi:hypothetical protein
VGLEWRTSRSLYLMSPSKRLKLIIIKRSRLISCLIFVSTAYYYYSKCFKKIRNWQYYILAENNFYFSSFQYINDCNLLNAWEIIIKLCSGPFYFLHIKWKPSALLQLCGLRTAFNKTKQVSSVSVGLDVHRTNKWLNLSDLPDQMKFPFL